MTRPASYRFSNLVISYKSSSQRSAILPQLPLKCFALTTLSFVVNFTFPFYLSRCLNLMSGKWQAEEQNLVEGTKCVYSCDHELYVDSTLWVELQPQDPNQNRAMEWWEAVQWVALKSTQCCPSTLFRWSHGTGWCTFLLPLQMHR